MSDKCQHWSRKSGYAQASLYAACPWCELEQLKQELRLAEEGLANAIHDIERLTAAASAEATLAEQLRTDLRRIQQERLTWAMVCECYCEACMRLDAIVIGAPPSSDLHPSTEQPPCRPTPVDT